MSNERTWYEWRVIHNGEGKTPNVRISMGSWMYQDCIWVVCGSGSGLGKSSEVWKFSTTDKSWDSVKCTGEPPRCRDGHSSTYIGDGKFIIFGGQGFPEPNLKLGRESEAMKTKTYLKREVYNDIMLFNCNTLEWSPVYPDGLSIPMGRRAHSAIYMKPTPIYMAKHHSSYDPQADNTATSLSASMSSYSTYQSSQQGDTAQSNFSGPGVGQASTVSDSRRLQAVEAGIQGNALLVFGGVGIELSKYTEQLYNELWSFSFEANQWSRPQTRGIEPRAVYDHRTELQGDMMIVVGGIAAPCKVNAAAFDASPLSDVMVLNTRTSTWSYVKLCDSLSRPVRFLFHGFSMVPDSSPDRKGIFYIFGGRQVVDSMFAATSRARTISRPYQNDLTLILNINDGTLLPAKTPKSSSGIEDRYGHLGVSAARNVDDTPTAAALSAGGSDAAAAGGAGGVGKGRSKKSERRRAARQSGFLDMMQETQTDEPLMYVFGGSSLASVGFCDPQLHSLVRVVATGDASLLKQFSFTGDPDANKESSNAAGTGAGAADGGDSVDLGIPVVMTVGFRDRDDRPDSPQFPDGGLSGGSLVGGGQSSIWENLQNKMSEKDRVDHDPSNWEELKLSLSPPLSLRYFPNERNNRSGGTEGDGNGASGAAAGGGGAVNRGGRGGRMFTAPEGGYSSYGAGLGASGMGDGGDGAGLGLGMISSPSMPAMRTTMSASHVVSNNSAGAGRSALRSATSRMAGLSSLDSSHQQGGSAFSPARPSTTSTGALDMGMSPRMPSSALGGAAAAGGGGGGSFTPGKSKSVMFKDRVVSNQQVGRLGGNTGFPRPNTAPAPVGFGSPNGRASTSRPGTTDSPVRLASSAAASFAGSGSRARSAPAGGSGGGLGTGGSGFGFGNSESGNIGTVNGSGVLAHPAQAAEAEEKARLLKIQRIKALSSTLKPLVKSKTKVDALNEYRKICPPPKKDPPVRKISYL